MIAFDEWYQRYHPLLVAALTVVAGDAATAQDAADEALVRAYERWGRVAAMDSPEAWTYRVGVNLLRRRARRAALEARVVRRGGNRGAEPDLRPEVWAAVRQLPRRQREAIALRYVLDLSEQQVAAVMGVAEGTASATLVVARRALASVLDDDDTVEVT